MAAWERWGGGMGMRSGQEGVGGVITKGHKENLGSDEYLIMVMVSRVNMYVKISQIEHFKYVHSIRESIYFILFRESIFLKKNFIFKH